MTSKTDRIQAIIDILLIFVLTVVIGTVLILACGANPVDAYRLFLRGVFGNFFGFAEIFVKACPLILTGLGCAVAFQTGFFNIGAEGQFYVGALAATIVSLNLQGVPGMISIILSLIAGFICGGLWALIAAILKAKYNISEIIVTIMLNYIASNFLGYAVRSFLMDPAGNVPQSAKISSNALLPTIIPSTGFHAGILIAIACSVLVWYLMKKTALGYELKAVGLNKRAAACNGISVLKNIILSAFLSGGLAALAGVIEVLAVQKKLLEGISSNCGYTAVLIALIAANSPIGVLAVAILYAALQIGANSMQRQMGVPSAIVNILIGVVVVLILGKELFHFMKKRDSSRNEIV
ncbi:ABC transporter permease [Desulfosporosinus sp. PR]|uniref:ABC transporter permease n=1 Tax=Candidatus Desulfosporosinus nitrosoreducens TaxID=3401928 RepID=UPI0027F9000C|nr:ABC transporter permease [Desulfosporosinus sp. PR]MDQ7092188.1 ABC transporter permease [Desulfosporosinus sp. PR]